MLVKTIAIVLFLFICISTIISSSGWIKADERAQKESSNNKKLIAENERLKAVIAFNKLQTEMEIEEKC